MSSHIYHGPWINWSHGGLITGATITLSDQNGGLLTSFIATFVTLVGVQLWKILAFIIHQVRSTAKPEDGLFHQQQVLWRNTASPGGTAWTLMQQVWFWRNKANRSYLRTLTWAIFAVVYLFLFGLAAVFSSEISKAPGSQRLVVGDNCGFWFLNGTSPDKQAAWAQRQSNMSNIAATYARACYGGSYNPLQCSRYTVPSIAWDRNENATCPFKSDICYWTNTAAFQMTSKLIDSQLDMGINSPRRERLQLQKQTTCAPIRQRDYLNVYNITMNYPDGVVVNDTWWQLMYGPIVNPNTGDTLNYTAQVATHGYNDAVGYQLGTTMAFANETSGVGWRPIPAIFRDNADVTFLFLKPNSMRFDKPVDDPWFSAHYLFPSNNSMVWYNADIYVTTLGCAEQYRYCNPSNNLCSDYLGSTQLFSSLLNKTGGTSKLGLSTVQQAIALRFSYATQYSSIFMNTFARGASALRAQETVNELNQAPLPATQWHIEASAFFDTGLSAIQQHVLEYATGPNSIVSGARLAKPYEDMTDTETNRLVAKAMCYSQLINDASNTMSFSVLGMAVLFAVGIFIILTSLIIDRIVGWAQSHFQFHLHGRRAWMLDDKLQLHKSVFQTAGQGHWKEGENDVVPITTSREKFSRFSDRELFSPNEPDSPDRDGLLFQKSEYNGAVEVKTPHTYIREN